MRRNWMLLVAIALILISVIGMAGLMALGVLASGVRGAGDAICPWCGSLFDERGGRDDQEDPDTGPDRFFDEETPEEDPSPRGETTPSPGPRGPGRDFFGEPASEGESIYLYGATEQRHIPFQGGPVWFDRMGGGCASCHGTDARGGTISMMGESVRAPDIRYEALTTGLGRDKQRWTDDDIKAAVTRGEKPDGAQLGRNMPRWVMTEEEFDALLGYLKEMNRT